MQPKAYAGIGARATPASVCEAMRLKALTLQERGYILRSGGADGADLAFESGVTDPSMKEIFIPWKGFNGSDSRLFNQHPEAFRIAKEHTSYWSSLSDGVKKIKARNVHQVLGKNLEDPSAFVLCWTPDGKIVGGTGLAISIAMKYNIPVFNIGSITDQGSASPAKRLGRATD